MYLKNVLYGPFSGDFLVGV